MFKRLDISIVILKKNVTYGMTVRSEQLKNFSFRLLARNVKPKQMIPLWPALWESHLYIYRPYVYSILHIFEQTRI